jgi:hypothetical protein
MDPLAAQNAAHYYHETQCGLCGDKLNELVFEGQRQLTGIGSGDDVQVSVRGLTTTRRLLYSGMTN